MHQTTRIHLGCQLQAASKSREQNRWLKKTNDHEQAVKRGYVVNKH